MIEARILLSEMSAIEQFKQGFEADTIMDIAQSLSCTEFEALIDLMQAFGMISGGMAKEVEERHAEADDCGDMHCRCTDPECIAEREG
ncbi:hypothetical protein SEA_ANON_85 [Gordonia phage Anon]|nr:hypothetical protein SEA_ANON_85 [Gordonia phage Anon]